MEKLNNIGCQTLGAVYARASYKRDNAAICGMEKNSASGPG